MPPSPIRESRCAIARPKRVSSSAQGIQRRLLQIGDVNGTQSLQVGIAAGKPAAKPNAKIFFGCAAVLALFIGVSAILAVTTRRILRAATYLLFVLFGTAGIYFQLNYSFLGAVQLLIYAGGITVLYVFSILLTSSEGDKAERLKGYKLFEGLGAALASLGSCLWITLRHDFLPSHFEHGELHVRTIGHALMSSGKYGYILPFEVISLLLLACIVGGIMIARKR